MKKNAEWNRLIFEEQRLKNELLREQIQETRSRNERIAIYPVNMKPKGRTLDKAKGKAL